MIKNCKEYVEIEKSILKEKIEKEIIKPKLVVIQIGDNPASNSYIKGKRKDCEEVGILFELIKFSEEVSQKELLEKIDSLNKNNNVNGIIVQLPIPKHLNIEEIQNTIDITKDVDGFNKNTLFNPCTPLGVINYLKFNNYDFEGKVACVIGRSDIVGKPLSKMLLDLNCTVINCHSKTTKNNLLKAINMSDIVFTCIDKIEYFNDSFESQDIIDIGLGKGIDNKLHGNLSKELTNKLKEREDKYTISGIGGVGLLTRLELLKNTYIAKKMEG